jgi:hypothetical protein
MMAKQYYATNEIRHGMPGGEIKTFVSGDLVVGLSKDDMLALWNAGALTEVDPEAAEKEEADLKAKIAELEAQLAEARAEAAAPAEEEKAPADLTEKEAPKAATPTPKETPATPAK